MMSNTSTYSNKKLIEINSGLSPEKRVINEKPEKPKTRRRRIANATLRRRRSRPPEETSTYQSLDVAQILSNQIQRKPRRRAVIVGCNYVITPDVLLRGACNDAAAMGLTLINMFDFSPSDIVLLLDAFPSPGYRIDRNLINQNFITWKERQPSRRNILLALNWLRADTIPGDVLLFFFAGHGIQVDDMSGWEGEGYDEAILPMDFFGQEVNVITAVMIRNLLLNVANDVQVTILLDCNGGQTMLDPCGTGRWNFIKGIKQRGVWPFVTDATDKVSRAIYDSSPWIDEVMKRRGARPRFVPGVDVSSTQDLLDPALQKPISQVGTKVRGYLIAAAPWSQSAIEAKMPAIIINPIDCKCKPIPNPESEKWRTYHGVFTWCFLTALKELIMRSAIKSKAKIVSYRDLIEEIEIRMKYCKSSSHGNLPKLNQQPELTFYRSGGGEGRDFFLWPFGGRRRDIMHPINNSKQLKLPLYPHEQHYLSAWEAEEQLNFVGELRRQHDPAFSKITKSQIKIEEEEEVMIKKTDILRNYTQPPPKIVDFSFVKTQDKLLISRAITSNIRDIKNKIPQIRKINTLNGVGENINEKKLSDNENIGNGLIISRIDNNKFMKENIILKNQEKNSHFFTSAHRI